VTRNRARMDTTVSWGSFSGAIQSELRLSNEWCDRKRLCQIVSEAYNRLGSTKTVQLLDSIKDLGFHFATVSGSGIALSDIVIPKEKEEILAKADKEVDAIDTQYRRGLITNEERYLKTVDVWTEATEAITRAMLETFDPFNPLYMMAQSGARGNIPEILRLARRRGLV